MSVSTLVVGVGGTGVLTVRALRKLYHQLADNERVPCEFLALDFDRSALITEDKDKSFDRLDETEFFYLNPKAIQDLLRNLDRAQNGNLAWEKVLRWFPDRAHVQIPASEVEANGASQLRVLGRLGFFLNDDTIEGLLRRKLSHLAGEVDDSRLSEEKRVVLISSLAGGTGAGMLIDLAYICRRLEGRPWIYAYLLLPEVFQDVDSGGRIFQNAYACLKELAYLKDQQIPFKAEYDHISPIDISVGGEVPFSRLYLCRGEGFSGSDAIKSATVSLAEQVLGQLQRSIQERTLAIVSNTLSSDAGEEQRKRRTHVFSSVTSVFVQLEPIKDAPRMVLRRIVAAPSDEALLATLFDKSVLKDLKQALAVVAAALASLNGKAPAAQGLPAAEPLAKPPLAEADELKNAVIDAWSERTKRSADGSKDVILRHLGDRLKTLDEKVRQGDPEAIEAGYRELRELAQLVFAELTLDTYPEFLEQLKKLETFKEEDAQLKDELSLHLAQYTLGSARGALEVKALLEKLKDRRWLFFAEFSPDPEHQKRIEALRKQWLDQQNLPPILEKSWWRRTFLDFAAERSEKSVQARSLVGNLQEVLDGEAFKVHLRSIIQARLARELRDQVEGLEKAADKWLEEEKAALEDQALAVRLGQETEPLPPGVETEIHSFLRRELPSLLDHIAKEIDPKDTAEAKEQKLRLVLRQYERDYPFLASDFVTLSDRPEEAEANLRAALVRARQRVFERRTPNPQRKSFGLILVPQGMVWPQGDRNALREFLEASTAQILGCRCQIEDYYGTRIWIYHEDLYNPPEHVRNLDEYYRLYKSQRYKELFHIDRRFLENPLFREIHASTSTISVTCGNPACRENISGRDRSEILCPGCERIILSRCGNAGCTLDGLNNHPQRHDKGCPACGGFNHSAWWCCTRHGKLPVEISTEKDRCPRCIEEHIADPLGWPAERISLRPDLRARKVCPHCVDRAARDARHEVFKIPKDLLPFYLKGVNGHDRERFLELARRHRLPEEFRCPNCRTHLIPVHHHEMKPSCARSTAS